MRKLGLIGGISWAATESYYRMINTEVQRRGGASCSAPLAIESLNYCDLRRLNGDNEWTNAAGLLIDAAQQLERGGATALLICANSMYKVGPQVQAAIGIPLIDIVDPVGRAMKAAGVTTAALLGTRNVMGERWYRQRLVGHGVSLVPADAATVEMVDRIIYDELMQGVVNPASIREMKTLLTKFDQADVDAIALASTELSLLIDTEANVLPIYDSTRLHAMEGVGWILADLP